MIVHRHVLTQQSKIEEKGFFLLPLLMIVFVTSPIRIERRWAGKARYDGDQFSAPHCQPLDQSLTRPLNQDLRRAWTGQHLNAYIHTVHIQYSSYHMILNFSCMTQLLFRPSCISLVLLTKFTIVRFEKTRQMIVINLILKIRVVVSFDEFF